jgi:hypothetical protein
LPESVTKKSKKEHSGAFDTLTKNYFKAYLSGDANSCKIAQKCEKASVYVEGLLSNGGPSTDVFKKEFGEEKTAHLFRNILFGTGVK